MRFIVFALSFFLVPFGVFSQVGIGTDNPEAILDVVSSNSGLVLPRVVSTAKVINPVEGMLIYDLSVGCAKFFEKGEWSICITDIDIANNTSVVNDCDLNSFSRQFLPGDVLGAGDTFSVTITNNSFSDATVSFTPSDLQMSGTVGTVTVDSVSPTSANITQGTSQLVTYELSSVDPLSFGFLSADWNKLALSCRRTLAVNGDATASLPLTKKVLSFDNGSFTHLGMLDNSTNKLSIEVPYTSGLGPYQEFIGDWTTPIVADAGGQANRLRLSYPSGTFTSTTGTISAMVEVEHISGDETYEVPAQVAGETGNNLVSFDFYINGNLKGVVHVDAVGAVLDKRYGDGSNHDFIYVAVQGEDGHLWLNNNLGADYANEQMSSVFDPAQQAKNLDDYHAYGSFFQWGRAPDGHELVVWKSATQADLTTSVEGLSDNPQHDDYIERDITTGGVVDDWRITTDNTLWDSESKPNNPCPAGYRVPTAAEFTALYSAGSITDRHEAFASALALPSAGFRDVYTSNELSLTNWTIVWTSTPDTTTTTEAYSTGFNNISNQDYPDEYRSNGLNVRCIEDY